MKFLDVDPIKYNLLFERFLNPDRISLPDIDIDFDDEGRDKIINYVIEKYDTIKLHKLLHMEVWQIFFLNSYHQQRKMGGEYRSTSKAN